MRLIGSNGDSALNTKATLVSVLSGLIQCVVGAYILSDHPPQFWSELLNLKFVMAVGIFSTNNGFLAHKSWRDSTSRTRSEDTFNPFLSVEAKKKEK